MGNTTRRVTWLHLSDLHYRVGAGYERYNRKVVLAALFEDIHRRGSRIDPALAELDFVVVTGDVAFSGKGSEYALAEQEFIPQVLEAAGLRCREQSRLFVVPGNHDVDRAAITDGARQFESRLASRDDINQVLLDPTQRTLFLKRQESYFDFLARLGAIEAQQPGGFFVSKLTTDSNVSVTILGLNTAWLAEGGPDDRGKLAIGEVQVERALDLAKAADVRVALIHHPFGWLRQEDRSSVEVLLSRGCHFILRGHLHGPNVVRQHGIYGDIAVIASGSAYGGRDRPNGYNYVSLDLDSGKTTVYFRRWNDERSEWQKDVRSTGDEADGRIILTSPGTLRPDPSPRPTPVADQVRSDFGAMRRTAQGRWRRVDGLRPSTDYQRIVGRSGTVAQLRQFLTDRDVACVAGLPGVGKTTVAALYVTAAEQEAKALNQSVAVLWLNLTEEVDLSDIVGTVMALLDVKAPDLAAYTETSLVRLLIEWLRERPAILVLDQAENLLSSPKIEPRASWVDSLLQGLRQRAAPSKVLIVSSTVLQASKGLVMPSFTVHGLDPENAVKLLQQRGARGTESALYEAARRVAGHPYALILVAQAAQSVDSVDLLLTNDALWQGEGEDIASRLLGPIWASHVDQYERKLLEVFSILRYPSSIGLVSVLTGDPSPTSAAFARAANSLVSKSLLNSVGSLYWPHPIVRAYVRPRIADPEGRHRRAASFFEGMAYFARERREEFVTWALEAIYHAEQIPDLESAARLINNLSGALFDRGSWHLPGVLVARLMARDPARAQVSHRARALLLANLGRSLRYEGRVAEAVEIYKRALREAELAPDDGTAAVALCLIGAAELSRNHYEAAARRSRRAIQVSRKVNDKGSEAAALGNLGIALRHLNRSAEAERRLKEALQIQRQIGDHRNQVVQLSALAQVSHERHDVWAAETYLQEAIDLADREDLLEVKAQALASLGDLYWKMELPTWAIQRLREALSLWRRMDITKGAIGALLELGTIYSETTRPKATVVCALLAKTLAPGRDDFDPDLLKVGDQMLDAAKAVMGDDFAAYLSSIESRSLEELDALLDEPPPKIGLVLGHRTDKEVSDGEVDKVETSFDPIRWNDWAAICIKERREGEDLEFAEDLLRAAIDCAKDMVPPYFNLGILLADQGRHGEAEWCLRHAARLDPDDPDIQYCLALFLAERERWQESLKYLRMVSKKRPDSVEVLEGLAIGLMYAGGWGEAATIFQRLVNLAPTELKYRAELGVALSNAGEYESATPHIERVLEEDPTNERALVEKARILGKTEHFAEVVTFVEHIPADAPLSAHTRSRLRESLGIARSELGEPGDGEQLLREAIELDPTNASAISNLGVLLAERGQLKEAARQFRKCLTLDTRHWTSQVHANLADVLLQLGAVRGAEEHCRQALELKPDCKEALEVLKQIEAQAVDLSANNEEPPSPSRPVSKRRARRKRSKKRRRKR